MNLKVFYFFTCFALLLSACEDDGVGDDPPPFPPFDKGEIEVNRYFFTVIPSNNPSQKQTIEFYDPDGSSGQPPIVQETLFLMKPSGLTFTYDFELEIYNYDVDVTDDIIANGTLYVVCYRDYNDDKIRIGNFNEDSDGVILGTNGKLSTADDGPPDNGRGNIRITISYQPSGKEGLCDPGVRVFEGEIPYQIN